MRARLVTEDYERVGFAEIPWESRFVLVAGRLFERQPIDQHEAFYREVPSVHRVDMSEVKP